MGSFVRFLNFYFRMSLSSIFHFCFCFVFNLHGFIFLSFAFSVSQTPGRNCDRRKDDRESNELKVMREYQLHLLRQRSLLCFHHLFLIDFHYLTSLFLYILLFFFALYHYQIMHRCKLDGIFSSLHNLMS